MDTELYYKIGTLPRSSVVVFHESLISSSSAASKLFPEKFGNQWDCNNEYKEVNLAKCLILNSAACPRCLNL